MKEGFCYERATRAVNNEAKDAKKASEKGGFRVITSSRRAISMPAERVRGAKPRNERIQTAHKGYLFCVIDWRPILRNPALLVHGAFNIRITRMVPVAALSRGIYWHRSQVNTAYCIATCTLYLAA